MANPTPEQIIAAGYSIGKRSDPTEPYLVFRKIDGLSIGRVQFEGGGPGNGWAGRYWMYGGGTTFGGFHTRTAAAKWILERNANLGEGWDN